jgi:hypothetical protein
MVIKTADKGEITLSGRVCSVPWPPVSRKDVGQTAEKGIRENRNATVSVLDSQAFDQFAAARRRSTG